MMAKFWCKNCYKVFDMEIFVRVDVIPHGKCVFCESDWTEYIPYTYSFEYWEDQGTTSRKWKCKDCSHIWASKEIRTCEMCGSKRVGWADEVYELE
jgi:Zn finger protein HypA/HybF involved in hydrogenase expression